MLDISSIAKRVDDPETNERYYLELQDEYRLIMEDGQYKGRYDPNLSEVI